MATKLAPRRSGDPLEGIKTTVEDPALLAKRRKQITDASIAVFRNLGFHTATIRDVARQANVSVGTIYQYIGDKEDLLFLALVDILNEYKRGIPRALEGVFDPLERFSATVRAYCRVHDSPEAATVLAYRETASLRKERRNVIKQLEIESNELIAECIREGIAAGIFHEDVDVPLFTYQVVMFCHAWALKAWYFAPQMTVEEYLQRGLLLMLRGVATSKGLRHLKRLDEAVVAPAAPASIASHRARRSAPPKHRS
jgi:TetR/AcrR family transcriptional regulator, cholesterol catabolism regulator